MNKQQPPQQQTLNVQIDQQVGEGVYANFFMIVNSDSEFVLDFGRVVPGMPNAKSDHKSTTCKTTLKAFGKECRCIRKTVW